MTDQAENIARLIDSLVMLRLSDQGIYEDAINTLDEIQSTLTRQHENSIPDLPKEFLYAKMYFPNEKEPQFKFFCELENYPYTLCAYGSSYRAAMLAAIASIKGEVK